MSEAEVFEKVKEIIIDHLGVDEADVKMEASLVDDLKADSLDTVEMIMSLEEEFSIDIEDSEAESLKTVGDAVRFIADVAGNERFACKWRIVIHGALSTSCA